MAEGSKFVISRQDRSIISSGPAAGRLGIDGYTDLQSCRTLDDALAYLDTLPKGIYYYVIEVDHCQRWMARMVATRSTRDTVSLVRYWT